MTCVQIKSEVKKNDATVMATARNEACIGWLHKNCYFIWNNTFGNGRFKSMKWDFFLVRKMSKFLVVG